MRFFADVEGVVNSAETIGDSAGTTCDGAAAEAGVIDRADCGVANTPRKSGVSGSFADVACAAAIGVVGIVQMTGSSAIPPDSAQLTASVKTASSALLEADLRADLTGVANMRRSAGVTSGATSFSIAAGVEGPTLMDSTRSAGWDGAGLEPMVSI